MKLSVVTPSFNQAPYLRATLESVHQQGYADLEHWVLDGGSTDGSLEILKEYQDQGLLQFISEPDRGQSDAINKGFSRCQGEIICWLNSDDLYYPDTFQRVVEFFQSHPSEDLVTGDCTFIDAEGKFLFEASSRGIHREAMIRMEQVPYQPATFFRRSLLTRAGLLNENLHYCMDYDLWLRMTRIAPMRYLEHRLAYYRLHQDAKSLKPNHQTFLPEVVRVSRQHWGNAWEPAYWSQRWGIHRHCSRVYYEQTLACLQQREYRNALVFLLKAIGYNPTRLHYWKDLAAVLLGRYA